MLVSLEDMALQAVQGIQAAQAPQATNMAYADVRVAMQEYILSLCYLVCLR